jgi:type IV pilus assembly protein PilE
MSRGVTLLELLTVLAIVSVVATLALPAYRQHVLRVHRSEAMLALLQVQSAEEKFYLRHGTYGDDIFSAAPGGLGVSATVTSRYQLSVALAADGQSFIATAAPTSDGGQAADLECLAFSIDARGRRAVSGARDARQCWK